MNASNKNKGLPLFVGRVAYFQSKCLFVTDFNDYVGNKGFILKYYNAFGNWNYFMKYSYIKLNRKKTKDFEIIINILYDA